MECFVAGFIVINKSKRVGAIGREWDGAACLRVFRGNFPAHKSQLIKQTTTKMTMTATTLMMTTMKVSKEERRKRMVTLCGERAKRSQQSKNIKVTFGLTKLLYP